MAGGPLIAIVDDDPSLRHATSDLVKAAGYTATAFESAEHFLAWPNARQVACLVADMRMPGMSGLELHRALRAAGRAMPTILITAHPEELARLRALAAGVCCYLSKPFAPDELLDCIGQALAGPCSGTTPRS
jgi:FixJ family two-component response regulator